VDDEPSILDGLGRMLRSMRQVWDMRFAKSGEEALEIMSRESFDLIVSDMRMPSMNGVQLLTEVKTKYPNTVRMILSGYADQLMILRSVGIIHQYMSKPCEADVLRTVIERVLNLNTLLKSERLASVISRTSTLPSLPSLYFEIVNEIQTPDSSVQRIGEIISKDPGMTAKILQLVNSAFFGIRRTITNPKEAASYLGIETIQTLVLSLDAFSKFEGCKVPGCTIEKIWSHSMATGLYAKRIVKGEGAGNAMADEAFTAGLLHDLGKLLLAFNLPREYSEVLSRATRDKVLLDVAEQEVFEATHEEVGAYLLGLWGLPDSIVESVAFHHHPARSTSKSFGLLAAVHAANALQYALAGQQSDPESAELDMDFMDSIGKSERLEDWRSLYSEN
jgi:HD-like signal output (HDOD) protein